VFAKLDLSSDVALLSIAVYAYAAWVFRGLRRHEYGAATLAARCAAVRGAASLMVFVHMSPLYAVYCECDVRVVKRCAVFACGVLLGGAKRASVVVVAVFGGILATACGAPYGGVRRIVSRVIHFHDAFMCFML
jgi:hypothetical protein